jgi:hypothetical protein
MKGRPRYTLVPANKGQKIDHDYGALAAKAVDELRLALR